MKKGHILPFIITLVLGFGLCYILLVPEKSQEPVLEEPIVKGGAYSSEYTFFSATTTTATSTNTNTGNSLPIGSAKKVTLMFQRGDTTGQGNTGTTTFRTQVSIDNSNWVYYNKLIDNVTNATANNPTRVADVVFSAAANYDNATSTKFYPMDLVSDVYKYVRVIAVEGTDGEHTARAIIQY